jgi:xanthine dehydrogenase accessory factor
VSDLPPRSSVLIMSFSHAEDLDVVAACLTRQRLRGDFALHRADWQQDQMGDFSTPTGRARFFRSGTGEGDLPDWCGRHHG